MMTDRFAIGQREEDSQPGDDSALWQFAADVAGVLFSPSGTLREIGRRGAIIPAMALVVLIVAISSAGQVAVLLLTLFEAPGFSSELPAFETGPIIAMQLTGILWNLVWGPVMWTILAGILYGVAYLLGGRGRFISLWAASGFSLAPQMLVAPLASAPELSAAFGVGWQLLSWLVVMPVTIAALIWTVVLVVISIRETMSLSTGRSLGVVGILFAGMVVLGILLLCAFFLVIAALIGLAVS